MLKKEYIVGALIVAVSIFGFVGTSTAGSPVSHDEAQISMWAQSDTMSTDNTQLRYNAPAGVVSNLDITTANFDDGLYVEEAVESTSPVSVQCLAAAGEISNLDHTTASLDARICS